MQEPSRVTRTSQEALERIGKRNYACEHHHPDQDLFLESQIVGECTIIRLVKQRDISDELAHKTPCVRSSIVANGLLEQQNLRMTGTHALVNEIHMIET